MRAAVAWPLLIAPLLWAALAPRGAVAQDVVSGLVHGSADLWVEGAVVAVAEVPGLSDTTDVSGYYRLDLPGPGLYRLGCRAEGEAPQTAAVEVAGSVQHNFLLLPQVVEGFETGDLAAHPWQTGGVAAWAATDLLRQGGSWSARSGLVDNDEESSLSIDLVAAADGEVAFWLRTSSEDGYDGLVFRLDDQDLGFWSGETDWTEAAFPVAAGARTLTWIYRKDPAVSVGQDAAWIDEVRFPGLGEPEVPALALAFASVEVTVQQGQAATRLERIGNDGGAPLQYRLAFAPEDVGGGPDEAGYTWTDSRLPGGPAYAWIELVGSGSPAVPAGDETIWGPFDLGFAFPFYGVARTRVWICSNGFLTFGEALPEYRNAALPDTTVPNDLVAPFWDDLDPSAGGQVLWRRDEAEQRFVVQWQAVPLYRWDGSGPPQTFQVVLRPDGRILFQYAGLSEPTGCSVGIEDGTGSVGLQVARDEAYLEDGLAVLVRPGPPVPWLAADPPTGSVAPGTSSLVRFVCDAESLAVGLHSCLALLRTDDPEAPLSVLPVAVQVAADLTGAAGATPPRALLRPPRPNPCNPRVELAFRLPVGGRAGLRIYDLAGRLVRTLVDGTLPAGEHVRAWDGRDGHGRAAPSGAYLVRLDWAGGGQSRRLTLVR